MNVDTHKFTLENFRYFLSQVLVPIKRNADNAVSTLADTITSQDVTDIIAGTYGQSNEESGSGD